MAPNMTTLTRDDLVGARVDLIVATVWAVISRDGRTLSEFESSREANEWLEEQQHKFGVRIQYPVDGPAD